ncbi:MAG TPA: creatininase family protein [Thermodesulfobacteriota bacterium]|nr:creatininase family protein [Thermodesulfobacteriota bacterium]
MDKRLIAEMTWQEVQELTLKTDAVIIPAGSTENNGPHLPLALDTIVGYEMALRLAERTSIPVAPPLPWGNSSLFARYPGTIVIRSEVLLELMQDLIMSLGRHGFRRFLILTPHLPNVWSFNVAGEAMRRRGYLVVTVDWWRVQNKLCADLTEGKSFPTGHASELATSILLALRPDLVRRDRMKAETPTDPFYLKHGSQYPMMFMYNDMKQLSDSGVFGDPTHATREKGEEIIRRCLAYLEDFCKDWLKAELPPAD